MAPIPAKDNNPKQHWALNAAVGVIRTWKAKSTGKCYLYNILGAFPVTTITSFREGAELLKRMDLGEVHST